MESSQLTLRLTMHLTLPLPMHLTLCPTLHLFPSQPHTSPSVQRGTSPCVKICASLGNNTCLFVATIAHYLLFFNSLPHLVYKSIPNLFCLCITRYFAKTEVQLLFFSQATEMELMLQNDPQQLTLEEVTRLF